jgi:hypothetical protein
VRVEEEGKLAKQASSPSPTISSEEKKKTPGGTSGDHQ